MSSKTPNDISYGVIVFNFKYSKREVLLVNRPHIDGYDLPKGHLDPDESTIDAALREVAEETGYKQVQLISTTHVFHTQYPITKNGRVVNKEVFFYIGELVGDEIPEPHHTDSIHENGMTAEWHDIDEARDLIKFEPMLIAYMWALVAYQDLYRKND